MAPKAKASYHHGDLRRALFETSLVLLREAGPEALSLREVARRAGVSSAAPYYHFASREELLAEVAAHGFAEMDRAMAEAQAAALDEPEAQFVAIGMGYLLFAIGEPALFRLIVRPEYLAVRRKLPASEAGTCAGPYGRLLATIRRLRGASADQRDADLCWSAVHGLAVLALGGALNVEESRLADHARAVLARLAATLHCERPRSRSANARR